MNSQRKKDDGETQNVHHLEARSNVEADNNIGYKTTDADNHVDSLRGK